MNTYINDLRNEMISVQDFITNDLPESLRNSKQVIDWVNHLMSCSTEFGDEKIKRKYLASGLYSYLRMNK